MFYYLYILVVFAPKTCCSHDKIPLEMKGIILITLLRGKSIYMKMSSLRRALYSTALISLMLPSFAAAGPFDGIYDEDTAKTASPAGMAFHQNLFVEYRHLSDARNNAFGDGIDAELFNHKALFASTRTAIQEDAVDDRRLNPDEQKTFLAAQVRLHNVFDAGGRELAPVDTAVGQVSYDCWIEATERHNGRDAQVCKNRFEEAMAAAESKANRKLGQVEIPAAPEPAPPPVVHSKPFKDYYRIGFHFDKTTMIPQGEAVMQQAIRDAQAHPDLKISLRAHADRSGSDDYNVNLSQRRAEAVLSRMAAAGISRDRLLIVQAVGESRPLVPTPDGVKEQANRVVEIDLRQYDAQGNQY